MTTTTVPYSPADAAMYAKTMTEARLGEVQQHLDDEYEEALALAGEYADWLATGGDPTDYPKSSDRDRHNHGLIRVAREAVFAMWNDTRPRRSVGYPWGQNQPWQWIVQEYMLDRVGRPVPLPELAALNRGQRRKGSPTEVAEAVWSIQVATNGQLRVRKTKVDGKVAWLVREPVVLDDLADLGHREGVYGDGLKLGDLERKAALERPFKRHLVEYPVEVL